MRTLLYKYLGPRDSAAYLYALKVAQPCYPVYPAQISLDMKTSNKHELLFGSYLVS
jgi:hypothetical protein